MEPTISPVGMLRHVEGIELLESFVLLIWHKNDNKIDIIDDHLFLLRILGNSLRYWLQIKAYSV